MIVVKEWPNSTRDWPHRLKYDGRNFIIAIFSSESKYYEEWKSGLERKTARNRDLTVSGDMFFSQLTFSRG